MSATDRNPNLWRIFTLFSEQLTDFIALSDSILKGGGSFMSLFRRVPFERYAADSRKMAEHWNGLVQNADVDIRHRFYGEFTPSERECFEDLIRWASAVRDAAVILADNQAAYAGRANNSRELTLAESRERGEKYNEAQRHYASLGEVLQDSFDAL